MAEQLTHLDTEQGPSLAAVPTPAVQAQDAAPVVLASNEQSVAQAILPATAAPAVKAETYEVVVKAPASQGMLAYLVGPGAHIVLQDIDLNQATVTQEGGNLRITLPNGAEVLLLDYVNSAHTSSTVVVTAEGEIPAQKLLAALDIAEDKKFAEVQPAAGPQGGEGGGLTPPTILGTGVGEGEGIFSSVIGPFGIPRGTDSIKTENPPLNHNAGGAPFNNVVAVDDTVTMLKDTSTMLINAKANDFDPQGDSFSITRIVSVDSGTAVIENGQIRYTNPTNGAGVAHIVYEITDSHGATDTATVTVNIEADTLPNLPPVAHDDSFSTAQDKTLTLRPGQLLANDSDPEGDPIHIISVQGASHGTVTIDASGNVVFVPEAGFHGTGSFSYTIEDSHGGTSTADVTIQIDPIIPNQNTVIAADDAASVVAGRDITINVLANDSDPQGDTLVPGSVRIISVNDPHAADGGHASVNPDGSISYHSVGRDPYTVTLVYEVADDKGARDTATVTIEVTPAANNVVAVDDTGEIIPAGATKVFNVTGNDFDPQGDAFHISRIVGITGGGTASFDPATGNITYQSVAGHSYDAVITYEIVDARGATDTATLTVRVEQVNNVSAVDDTAEVQAGQDVRINVLENDFDAQNDTFHVTRVIGQPHDPVTGAVRGSLVLNSDGTITFTDSAGQRGSGVVEFSYEITDSHGATDTAVVRVNITPAVNGVDANNDTLSVAQDSARANITGTLLANDFDPQGDAFHITAISTIPASQGTLELVGDQVFFHPATGFHGPVNFTYTITDALGAQDTAQVTLTVLPAPNQGLDAGDDNFTTPFNTNLTITPAQLLANDNDPDGTTLNAGNIISHTNPAHGTISMDAAGNFIYNPNDTFHGTDSFTYTIRDAQGDVATATVTIRVDEPLPLDNPVNAVDDLVNLQPGQTRTVNVLSNDSAPDGGLAFVRLVDPLPAGVTDLGGGRFSYTAPLNAPSGDVTFRYEVRDVDGDTDIATVIFRVTDHPVDAVNDVFTTPEDTRLTFTTANLLANDSAPDGGLAFVRTVGSLPAGMSFNGSTFTYNPPANFHGDVSFQYEVRDADGDTDIATVTIHVTPVDDPVNAVNDVFTTREDTRLTFTTANLLANDSAPDGGLAFVRTVGSLPAGLVFNGSTFTYNPPANFHGDVSFQYEVRDADGDTDIATVTIHVTPVDDPVNAVNDVFTTREDTRLTFTTANLLANDSAPDGGLAFVRTVGTLPAGLTYSNGNFTYNPPANFHGDVSFQYEVRDADGDTDIATVTIHVTPVDDPVNAVNDVFTTREDTRLTFTTANLLANDSAPDGGLAFVRTVGSLPAGLTFNGSTFTYNPPHNFHGDVSFQYEVRDADGDTDIATVTIHVTPVDDPVNAVNDVFTTREDTRLTFTTANLLANDSAPDGGLAFVRTVGSLPAGLTFNGSTFTYNPPHNFHGDVSFQYEVRDADGDTDIATVTIHVTSVNDGVDAVNDSFSTAFNTNLTITQASLLVNDRDLDTGTNAGLTIVGFTQPAHGTITRNAAGNFVFNPDDTFSGSTTFTYTVRDAQGETDTATVTITVGQPPNTVDAVNDTANAVAGHPVTINVLANDRDPQGDSFSVVSHTNPAHGTVVQNANGTFTYVASAGYSGTDTFTYTIRDARGATDTATVTVNVAPNSVDAVNDTANAVGGHPVTINVLANDRDPQGDTFSIVGHTNPAHGTVVQNANGTFTYVPAAGYHGTDTFTYTIRDALGATDTATVTVNVGANSVIANNDTATVGRSTYGVARSVVINELANDTDPQGDSFHFNRIVSGPAIGSVSVNANGTITYHAASSYSGYTTTFVYEIIDQYGATDTATVTVNVAGQTTRPRGGGGGGGGGGGDCPLTIDLTGHGINVLMQAQSTAHFDLNGDGVAEWTAWAGNADTGILAIDRNGDGIINDVNEVFGRENLDGFTELANLEDTNQDGVIDSHDANFANLRLWVDANSDGITDAGELHSLADFGITSIDLNAHETSVQYGDAYIGSQSVVHYADGHTGNIGSVFYTNDSNGHITGTTGNDILVYSSAADSIDGGQGADTLKVMASSDIVINHNVDVHGVENIDLANNGTDHLTLNVDDLLSITDNGVLTIRGDAVDQVTLTGDVHHGDNVTVGDVTYATYTGGAGGTVMVELGLSVHMADQNQHLTH